MNEFAIIEKTADGIGEKELADAIGHSIADCKTSLRSVLLIVPDITRFHSNAGRIANIYYHLLKDTCRVDLLVALGTNAPLTEEECASMYGDVPYDRFIMHTWRSGIKKLGVVSGEFVAEVSEGLVDTPIDVEVNEILWNGYDQILSIGQVVPHEVIGMASYSKNIFVRCGGSSMIDASHMLGSFYGLERIMGRELSPVRKVFDYAEQKYLQDLPLCYVLTVTTAPDGIIHTHGLYIGRERTWFQQAVAHSQKINITLLDAPLTKVVAYLDEREFRTTWLANKGIYRTRMAIADGGQLILLAPGVTRFGEDEALDRLIRKYGYFGRENIIQACKDNRDLQENLSAVAHIIHGSCDGRFSVTYCTKHLTRSEVEGVGFGYRPYSEAVAEYDPSMLKDGFNRLANGEEIYYISNPALGLWAVKSKLEI